MPLVEYDAQAEAVVMACGPTLWQAFFRKICGMNKNNTALYETLPSSS